MKKLVSIILLIFVLPSCSDNPDKSIDQDKLAIIDLYSYLEGQRADAKECLAIELEVSPKNDNLQYLSVNEIHNKICGGDPETIPSYGHYKRDMVTGALYQMNYSTSEYILLTRNK